MTIAPSSAPAASLPDASPSPDVSSSADVTGVLEAPLPPAATLPGRALRHLRALGHDLAPTVAIGKHGVTEAVVTQAKGALLAHELVKVRVQSEAPESRHEAAGALAAATGAVLAQVLGRTFLLYKRHPREPKIKLPKATERRAAR